MTQLADSLLAAPAASFDFTGLAQTYNHLLIVFHARASNAAISDTLMVRFNGSSTATYQHQLVNGNAAVAGAGENLTQSGAWVGLITAANATANRYGGGSVLVPYYTSSAHKEVVSLSNAMTGTGSGSMFQYMLGGIWPNTAAITQVTLLSQAGNNLLAGSRATVYGLT